MVLVVCKTANRARTIGEALGDYTPALTLRLAKKLAPGGGYRAIVLDVFAGTSGNSAIQALPALALWAPVVVLTNRLDAPTIDQALALGAAGVVFRYADDLSDRVNEAVASWHREKERVAQGIRSRSLH